MQQWLYFGDYRRIIYIVLTLIFLFVYFNLHSKRKLRLPGSMYAHNARLFRSPILSKEKNHFFIYKNIYIFRT